MQKTEFTKFKLPNGVRVVLVPQKSSVATTVIVLVETGSKYETKKINGLSHFLEHMCFKGTTRRPKPSDISSELDGLGAVYNAFTDTEMTGYWAKAKNDAAPKLLDIVSDLYLNPTFDSKEIEKEKGVIIEEINMYEDLPRQKAGELFMKLVYGDQPAGWSIAGRKEVIRRTTREDFLAYRGTHYLAPATTVIVSGGFDAARMERLVRRAFGSLPRGRKGTKLPVRESQSRPREVVHFKKVEQTHLILGFRSFGIYDPRRPALQLMAHVLGGGMGSRLFKRVREELGAAYYVNASADFLTDHGIVSMSAGAKHEKLEAVLKVGVEEFGRFTRELVPQDELVRAKNHLTGTFLLSLETSDELGSFYGAQEVFHRPLRTPAQLVREIQRVSADDIRAVARQVVKPNRLNLAILGPYKKRSFRGILKL
ncbi:MAG: pitrilysin family protein [bacterium]|nr:pitrilysin family protein [bacterium]